MVTGVLKRPPELTTDELIGPGIVALIVEYDGSSFHGWQNQKGRVRSVDGVLREAVSVVADGPVDTVCAGRTDAGVHATYQVVHFESRVTRALRSWVLGINSNLPRDVRVQWVGQMPSGFSARFSALSRRYRYVMLSSPTPPAILRDHLSWTHRPLDVPAMHQAARHLLGEHDFSAFRAAGCQSTTPWREVKKIHVVQKGPYVVLDIEANAFLHHMVRNIAGSLMRVGQGEEAPEWLGELLAGGDRRVAGITAPAQGLYLVDVKYPGDIQLPEAGPGPSFIAD